MATQRAAHYEVLGVDPSASTVEIRRRYLELARASHPDLQPEGGSRAGAEERMRAINEAWAVLGDVEARSAYDRDRLTGRARPPFHATTHGAVDEPDAWRPFDDGPDGGFDERDDRPITDSALPGWMKTFPALGVLFGLAAVISGSLIDLTGLVDIGLMILVVSALLFLAAPMVALSRSRSQDRRP